MCIQIRICHGLANPITVEVCQVEIINTVDEIFTLEYEEIDFQNSRYPSEQSFSTGKELCSLTVRLQERVSKLKGSNLGSNHITCGNMYDNRTKRIQDQIAIHQSGNLTKITSLPSSQW